MNIRTFYFELTRDHDLLFLMILVICFFICHRIYFVSAPQVRFRSTLQRLVFLCTLPFHDFADPGFGQSENRTDPLGGLGAVGGGGGGVPYRGYFQG